MLFALEELDLVTLAVRGPQRLEQAMPFRIRLDDPQTQAALLNEHQPQRIAGSLPAAKSRLAEGR